LIQFFVYYWLVDVQSPLMLFGNEVTADFGEGLIIVVSSFTATWTALAGGVLSDRFGRKPLIYLSSIIQAAAMVAMGWTPPSFYVVLIMMGIFGIGVGMYAAVDWALINDVLPDHTEAAKDLGIWQIALTLPFVILNPVVGYMLDALREIGVDTGRPGLGSSCIYTWWSNCCPFRFFFVHYVKLTSDNRPLEPYGIVKVD